MIEVRIRHDWDRDSIHLMDVPYDKLDDVIPLINRWGLYAGESIDPDRLQGQFWLKDNAAYFEVMIEAG